MRDIVSCFNENAVNVSHPSCSSYANTACISPNLTPSVQNAVSCFYKITLSSTQKQLLVRVSWCKNHYVQGLTIKLADNPSAASFKLNTNSRIFRKKKGTKVIESDNLKIEIFWDLSRAKYEVSGPEPVEGIYILVMIDSEIGLVLGDMAEEAVSKKFKTSSVAKASLVSRQDHCSGNALYSTRAQFSDTGTEHDILIKCSGENEGLKHPVLSFCIDKKTVIRVKRLQWNFRGIRQFLLMGCLLI